MYTFLFRYCSRFVKRSWGESGADPASLASKFAWNRSTLFLRLPHKLIQQVQVVAGLGMVPVLPKHLADRACKLSLLGTVFSLGFSLYRVLWETKCVEHACNLFVAVYTWSQGLFPFDVLCVASHISDAFKEWQHNIVQTLIYWNLKMILCSCNIKLSPEQIVNP
ncbi:uncharacterized protein LOC124706945 [Lolium rigidum]|uniref:uncharacterized protein LOC124706945 n=1 Tax=Lolium rigidum TaxID=89674 RepID=UPI001F5D76F0|nr:uncharacterized protein LOC124706945 [Lolium rigidum]